ncbi:MAG TPA: DUF5686 family protein [Parapedobacter sp.]|uniref:DUF5686 and carboxypeptidase-like regulatory domain-containing protein n=1 Tax=Parapedobacter sp. TaxID=1958893 RepID=UPI002B80CA07|nr:DUF5686 family protein [Parapedobacter sp.]HWK56511.1 DUF5686 family protein [Parapedobacter sp.]
MRIRSTAFKGTLLLMGIITFSSLSAQPTIRGKVTDAATHEGIPGATVALLHTEKGTSTDSSGNYTITPTPKATAIQFTALGYKTVTKWLDPDTSQTIDVELEEDFKALDEVVVSGKGKYRNRNNPAVELIRKVIEHKGANRLTRFDHVSFDAYEKTMVAVSNVPKFVTNNALTRGYRFAFENVDTTLVPGRSLLPIYLEENLSKQYRRLYPKATKTVVTGNKKTELDARYVNNENIQTYFNFIYTDVDIYENNVLILNKPFLSPTADAAPLFYKFFITDTISAPEGQFVELTFVPRNETDRLFSGRLHITLDGNYGIRRADIRIDQRANLNWVNDLTLSLRFDRHDNGVYLPAFSDMKINFGLQGSEGGAFGQRTLVYSGYDTETTIPATVFDGSQPTMAEGADDRSAAYWDNMRPLALTTVEANTYANLDSLQDNRSFRRTLKLGYLLSQSYVNAGPVEFGPVEYTYSFNDLEGNRIRIGGRTTPELSKKVYAEAYTAYGTTDKQLKFYGSVAHALNQRRVGEYPAHYMQLTYQHDAREPGQLLGFRNGDSFIRSFRSDKQDKWSYFNVWKLSHVVEFGNHFMLQTAFVSQREDPAANLHFITAATSPDTISTLRTSELVFDLRWAPHEAFFQRNLERTPIINEYPIFNLRYNIGLKGPLGGAYSFHALRLGISKRLFLSQLGLADINLTTGYLFGTVPFPLLDIPYASKTYALSQDAYALMNDLEFVNDQYIKLHIEHRLHGFILNKVPLLKRLKIREVVGFKLLYGNVRPENRPENNPAVYLLPTDANGNRTTFIMGRRPYMEASAGFENILNVLRVEYVRRLSYLNHPDIDKGGIRFSVKVDF